ncbi:MAG: TldD/PmbA family protein [Deltaproteobacteria bacterium]|nr:TldD/PmbA family protein [Deltaproteobacteria bacterium]MCB9788418.1 TldD/PmbA family protein [Deltaproteobacteria bacterium]
MREVFEEGLVAERLDLAMNAARADADGVEVLFRGHAASFMRLAEAAVVQAADVVEGKVTVRAVVGGREARVVTTDLTDAGLRACAQLAVARAKEAPAGLEPAWLAEPGGAPTQLPGALDPETAALDAETKGRWLAPGLEAHARDGLALAGRFHTGELTLAVRSTTGVDAFHRGSFSELCLSSLERPAGHRASAYRARTDARVDEATVADLAETTRDECRRARDPVSVELGAWDVVLAPPAVAELLMWLGEIAFTSRAVDDGLSFVEGRVGEQVTGEAVSIVDDGSMPHGVGVPLPFDAEGQPKRRTRLLEHGVARGIVYDSASARRAGCASTGHAALADEFPTSGSKPTHLHLEPGTASPEALIGRLDRGLLVTRLHYVNGMIEPKRAVMTGLLRDAAFLVEGGRPVRAVQPMRFTDSILEAFARIPGIDGLSRDLEAHTGWFDPWSCQVAPWVLVPGLRFTSGR